MMLNEVHIVIDETKDDQILQVCDCDLMAQKSLAYYISIGYSKDNLKIVTKSIRYLDRD